VPRLSRCTDTTRRPMAALPSSAYTRTPESGHGPPGTAPRRPGRRVPWRSAPGSRSPGPPSNPVIRTPSRSNSAGFVPEGRPAQEAPDGDGSARVSHAVTHRAPTRTTAREREPLRRRGADQYRSQSAVTEAMLPVTGV
jgi:hypothetical protein